MVGFGSVNELKHIKDQTGYEISKHVTLQANYMKINTDDTLNADTDAVRFTVNYTWY